MVKPMFVDNPEMWDLWSQFKLGPDLVIAAVMDGDQHLVNVSLPSGSWFEFYSGIRLNLWEVKMRGPDQGLGPIPASKIWGSGTFGGQKIMLWDQSLRLQVLWSQTSNFLVLGLDPITRNCYLWDQMLSSNPMSSPCVELMGLQPMLLPNLTQNKEVFLPSNSRGKN